MFGIKISALPAIPSVQASDIYASVQGGITYKATITQLIANLNGSYLQIANNLSDVNDAKTSWYNLMTAGLPQHSINAITTLTSADYGKQVLCSGAAAYTVTLPAAAAGKFIDFQIVTTSNAIVTLSPAAGTIAGQATIKLGTGDSLRLYSDGTNWWIENLFLQPANFLAYCSTNQTIANNATTKIKMDAETYDVGGFFDSTTNYRYTPLLPGKYSYFLTALFNAVGGATTEELVISLNGGTTTQNIYLLSATINQSQMSSSDTILMNGSTDYIESLIYQNSGGNLNIQGTAPQTFISGNRSSLF